MMSEQVSRGGLTVYNTRIPEGMDRRGHWKEDVVNLTENRLFGQYYVIILVQQFLSIRYFQKQVVPDQTTMLHTFSQPNRPCFR